MQYKFFNIPTVSGDTAAAEEEMNAFLRGHRVLTVQRELVNDGGRSFWSCCVEYLDGAAPSAGRNPDWGYKRIARTMNYLGYDISASTVKNILDDYGIVPDPERRVRGDWDQFIETQQYVTAATDFVQVERLSPFGLIRESLLFFMDIGTREVRLGGIVHDPDGNWTTQIARNMCDMWDGFMLGKRYLIHDRDTLFHRRFDMIFESIGVKIKKLPPFTPQMNSRMENFIRAIKTECLDKMIFTSQS